MSLLALASNAAHILIGHTELPSMHPAIAPSGPLTALDVYRDCLRFEKSLSMR